MSHGLPPAVQEQPCYVFILIYRCKINVGKYGKLFSPSVSTMFHLCVWLSPRRITIVATIAVLRAWYSC